MYKNIQDAREIKDRLLCRGHDVDETVLCELLENVPKFAVDRVEYIISMIADDEDYNFKESLNEAESSSAPIEIKSKMHHSIEKIPKSDTQNFSIEHNDTIDLSSDSNDDRDFYYQTTNWDDISVVDTMTSSSPSHPLLEVCNVTPSSNQVTIIVDQTAISDNNNYYNNQDAVDIEFLEENNNDPNNNLGFAQMLEDERNNPTIDVIHERNRLSESPKPGCSKDSDDSPNSRIEEQQKDADSRSFDCNGCTAIKTPICNDNERNVEINVAVNPESRSQTESDIMVRNNCKKISDNQSLKNCIGSTTFSDSEDIEDLQKNAKQIHALLPRFEYSLIYKTLLNYRSKDRIELTLRNLLSVEKPVAHCTSESEYSGKIPFTECAKCPDNSPKKNLIDTRASLEMIKQTRAENKVKVSHINTENEEFVSGINGETDKLKRYIMEVTAMDETDSASAQNSLPKKAKMNKDIISSDNNTRNVYEYSEEPGFSKSSDARSKNYEELSIVNDSVVGPVTLKKIHQTGVSSCMLRPARFTFDANNTYPSSSASVSTPILAPAKFKYNRENLIQTSNANECNTSMGLKLGLPTQAIRKAKNLSVKMRDKKKSLNVLMDDQKTSLNKYPFGFRHRSTSLQSNIFIGNPVWSSTCTWNTFGKVSHSEGTSSNKLLGTFINSKITLRNKTPSNIETKETKLIENADVCTISTLMPLSLPQSSKQTFEAENDRLYCTQAGETNNMPTTSISEKNKSIEDDRSNNSDQQKDRITELDDKQNEEQRTLFFGDVEDRSKTTHKVVRNNVDRTFVLNKKARKIYSKLIPMFPCISTDHIKELCQRSVEDDGQFLDEAILLQNLAEQLLDFGQEQPSIIKEPEFEPSFTKTSNTYDVNEQYADLLGIFPEADPVYLRQIAEEMYNDPEGIKEFVQSKLENPDYPTREQYLAKKKITEQQKQYTTDFQVQQFLEIFPDPFSYFEDEKRQCRFQSHAIDFLKHYFNKIRVNTLLKLYIKCMHNLSLTVKNLEKLSPDMKSKRYFSNKMLTENIPLLQECAFIQHKMEIREHLAELKKKEEEEFNELKANNALLECQCCYDNECMPSKCSMCEDGHIFCNSCIARSTDVVLADGKTQVDCLINCGCGFSLSVLQRILLPTKFSILLQKRQEAEVMAAGLEGLVSCPFCHFASIPPPEDNVFKCFNPDCMKESCRLCKELNHIPLKCNEVKSDAARLYLEEKMTEALVRKCYRCGKMFFKEEGCNKMTCPCGAQMCYICDEPVTNYEHFQGPGASPSKLCPLWSDDLRMNAESVIKVCHETMKHIKEKNPKVDINIDALLPELPFKNTNSHEDIAHADTLLIRADRIARQIP